MTEKNIQIARASAEAEGGSSAFGLPSSVLKQSRRRVRVVGWFLLLGVGIDLASQISNLVIGTAGPLWTVLLPANILSFAIAGVLVFAAGNERVRTSQLVNLALAAEVLLCLSISITNPWAFYRETGAIPRLHWVTPLIILFPLVVACPPRRTIE